MSLTCCITARNDQAETNATIRSIRETAGDKVEVVVLDDGSDIPLTLEDRDVVFRRVAGRAGVGPARHMAATMASNPHLLICDAHMRFEEGWLERALPRLEAHPDTLWGCTCVGLSADNMDMDGATKFYNGAKINFYGPNKQKPHLKQFIEPVWLSREEWPENNGEIQTVLGAAYFIPRNLFFKVGGTRMLRSWGSYEPYLSLKVWLSGGSVRQMTDVRIGHQFRTATTYRSKNADLFFNKLMIATTLFPQVAAEFLVRKMDEFAIPAGDFKIAKQLAVQEQAQMEVERVFGEVVFNRDLEWFFDKFKLHRFWLEG